MNELNIRNFQIRKPNSIDETTKSVEVIATTEASTQVFDYERFDIINEILLMSGAVIPENKQLPLLDSHNRDSISDVLGSVRNLKVENDKLVGRVFLADSQSELFQRIKDGHVTDFSIGYRVDSKETVFIPEGETGIVEGKQFQGEVLIRKKWYPKELSIVPIGADPNAKARSEHINNNVKQLHKQNKEKIKMEQKLRELLISKGMPPSFSDDEAMVFLQEMEAKKSESITATITTGVDVELQKKSERERALEITALCKKFDKFDELETLMKSGKSVDEIRKLALNEWIKDNPVKISPATVIADERDKFKSAAETSLLKRVGFDFGDKKPENTDIDGFQMRDIAKEILKLNNLPLRGSIDQISERAMSTSDFPYLLSNVANKMLFQGWDTANETWSLWCNTGSVPDAKINESDRVSEVDTLEVVPEGSEIPFGNRSEAQEQYKVKKYAKRWKYTDIMLINDDLNVFRQLAAYGESSARVIGDIVYAVLTDNAAMGDGVALFDSTTHLNLATSLDVPGLATLGEAVRAMKMQTDLQGIRRLNIRPRFFIAPVTMEGATEQFFNSTEWSDHSTVATDSSFASTRTNIYSGTYFTRIYEPRLDSNSTKFWYLAADKGKTVTVFFLNGQESPTITTYTDEGTDSLVIKVKTFATAKAMDYRGLYCNPDT